MSPEIGSNMDYTVEIIRHADKGKGTLFPPEFKTHIKDLQRSLFHSKRVNKNLELEQGFSTKFINTLESDGLSRDEAKTVLQTIYGNERLFGLMFKDANLPLTIDGLRRSIALGNSQFEMIKEKLLKIGGKHAVIASFVNRKSNRNSLTGLLAIQQIKNRLDAFNKTLETSERINIKIHERGLKAEEARVVALGLADLPDATWKKYEESRKPKEEGGEGLSVYESVRRMIKELRGKTDHLSETPEQGAERYKQFVLHMFEVLKEDYRDESAVVRVAMAIGHSGPLLERKDIFLSSNGVKELKENYGVDYCEKFFYRNDGSLERTEITKI